jgi:hypothetical protein
MRVTEAITKLQSSGTALLGIGIANQPLCLGVGLNGQSRYVSVIANSGNPPQWQINVLGADGETNKCEIGTPDGQFWWYVPGGDPFPNCINLVPDRRGAATIIFNIIERSFSGPYTGGNMAPTGGPSGFYFATNAEQAAPVVFFASS